MHPTTQIPTLRHGSRGAETLPPPVEVTPELIAHHIQLGRQLRSETLARLAVWLVRRLGAALTRLVERQDRVPRVGPAVR